MYPNFQVIKQFHDWGIQQDLDWYCQYGFINKDEYAQLTGNNFDTKQPINQSSNQQSNPQSNSQSSQASDQNTHK